MKKMKELSVILVHKSIYLMNLWKMRQQSDELIRAFAARVTSTADMCNMVIKCLDTNCQKDVTYRDQVVHQIIIHGMRNNDIRMWVLSWRIVYLTRSRTIILSDIICGEGCPPPFFSYGGRKTNRLLQWRASNAEASDLVSDSDLVGGIRRRSSYYEQKNVNRKQTCQACGEGWHDGRKTVQSLGPSSFSFNLIVFFTLKSTLYCMYILNKFCYCTAYITGLHFEKSRAVDIS